MSKSLSKFIKKINDIKKSEDFLSSIPSNQNIDKIDPNHTIVLFQFIALAARLITVDGIVDDKELDTLFHIFPKFLNAKQKVQNIFNLALQDQTPAMNFAKKIKQVYPEGVDLFYQLIEHLIKIADSDGPINTSEYMFLSNIANEFELDSGIVDDMIEQYLLKEHKDPYQILEINRSASMKDINNAYKAKVKKFHPDKIFSELNVASTYKNSFEKKYQEISQAYHTLLRMKTD